MAFMDLITVHIAQDTVQTEWQTCYSRQTFQHLFGQGHYFQNLLEPFMFKINFIQINNKFTS